MSSDCRQEATSGQNGESDENKEDFRLLTRRQSSEVRSASSSASRATSSSSGRASSTTSDMVWPLQLTANFVDHYIIGDVIGQGSYAEVRECVDTKTLERCALKIVNKSFLNRQAPRALANQLLEIRLLRRLEHPNIIKMRECLYRGDCIYIALEYCALSLDEILTEQQPGNCLRPPVARSFFVQLCAAVAHLHTIGIVHRDIKPENILFTTAGALKLIDFGVSQILSIWQTRDLCSNYEGSPLFQAPEVVSGQREYLGCKVDVWACGITLYLMLYGQYPFMDEALLGLYDKILADNLSIPPEAPPTCLALTDLLGAQMLVKDCEQRATIEQVLEHPWCRLFETTSDCDPIESHSEFFDLVVVGRHHLRTRAENLSSSSQIYARSQQRDTYKSMSCLPYLYKHHFPELPIVNSSTQRRSQVVNLISPSASVRSSQSGASSASSSTGTATESSSQVAGRATLDDAQTNESVEWGTREQYQLMKLPQVRANRIRCGPKSRKRRRRRHAPARRIRLEGHKQEQPRPSD